MLANIFQSTSKTKKKEKEKEDKKEEVKQPLTPGQQPQPQCRIFGTHLETLVKVYGTAVPGVVRSIIQFVERDGRMETPGLFATESSPAQRQQTEDLKNRFEIEKHVDLKPELLQSACDLLRVFLNELPDPVLTYDLYDDFMNASSKHQINQPNPNNSGEPYTEEDEAELDCLLELQRCVSLLPQVEKFFFSYLLGFWSRLLVKAEKNHLTSEKLGRVFGSLILFPREMDKEKRQIELNHMARITRILIENYQVVCFSLKSSAVKRKPKKTEETSASTPSSSTSSTSSTPSSSSSSAASPATPVKEDEAPTQPIMLPSKVSDDLQVVTVRAVRDFEGGTIGDLPFRKGDYIRVLQSNPNGIWQGECEERVGNFPCDFCEVIGVVKKLQYKVNKTAINPKILKMQQMIKKEQEQKEELERKKELDELAKSVGQGNKDEAWSREELEAAAPKLVGPRRPAGPVRRLPAARQAQQRPPEERKARPLGLGFNKPQGPSRQEASAPKVVSDPEKDQIEEKLQQIHATKHALAQEIEKLKKAIAQEKETQKFSTERVIPDLKKDIDEVNGNLEKIKGPLEESRRKKKEIEQKFESVSEELTKKKAELKSSYAKLQQVSTTTGVKTGSQIAKKSADGIDNHNHDVSSVEKQQSIRELREKFSV